MPVSVIVGGQFGSEGKGKVSAFLAAESRPSAIVRVGGPNSGHTAIDHCGTSWMFRQLPAGLVGRRSLVVLPAGSLIDVDILLSEVRGYGIEADQLWIDPKASIVTAGHRNAEADWIETVGSTASGTGAALAERIKRHPSHLLAESHAALKPFLRGDISAALRTMLIAGERIIIEGTQGFGLSIWHSDSFPYATSRDTSAACFVAEAGLAPQDVDDTVMVIRAFPIRVGGNSGPLPNEIDWPTLAEEARLPEEFKELTSATGRVRRVGRFDPTLVRQALQVNAPHRLVLNHMDYVDPDWRICGPTSRSREFIAYVEKEICRPLDLLGYGPDILLRRTEVFLDRAA